jgi:hypothetical protein
LSTELFKGLTATSRNRTLNAYAIRQTVFEDWKPKGVRYITMHSRYSRIDPYQSNGRGLFFALNEKTPPSALGLGLLMLRRDKRRRD